MDLDFLLKLIQGPVAGGALIGLAGAILLVLNGRILGVSGIAGSLVTLATNPTARAHSHGEVAWRLAFVLGLLAGGLLLRLTTDVFDGVSVVQGNPLVLAGAGLLVGIGTRLGLGCTSGHGVCGLARRSGRSLVATILFVGSGMVTVAIANVIVRFTTGGFRP